MSKVNIATKLLMRQEASKIKLEKLREKNELAKLKGCSFKPQVNTIKKSRQNICEQTVSIRYI